MNQINLTLRKEKKEKEKKRKEKKRKEKKRKEKKRKEKKRKRKRKRKEKIFNMILQNFLSTNKKQKKGNENKMKLEM